MQSIAKLVVLSLVLGAAPAVAADSAAKKPPKEQTKYCLQMAPSTGSRLSTTECRTRAEWAQLGVDVDEVVGK